MREPSDHVCEQGGWYHFYDSKVVSRPKDFPTKKAEPKKQIDAASMMLGWSGRTTEAELISLSERLGLSVTSLRAVDAVWAAEHSAWAFPMRDGSGSIIGIRLRNNEGFKWAVSGSRQGIFIPMPETHDGIVFLPEGPTDCAACFDLGLFAIGRPTCMTGGEQIKIALQRLGIHKAVIIADNDGLKQRGNGTEFRPGYSGAEMLRKVLGIKSVIWTPPGVIKDVREFKQRGGTAALIMSAIKNRIWTK